MQRAASSHDSRQRAGTGHCCSESELGSAGWQDSRVTGHGGRGCSEQENKPGVMSGGVMRPAEACMCIWL